MTYSARLARDRSHLRLMVAALAAILLVSTVEAQSLAGNFDVRNPVAEMNARNIDGQTRSFEAQTRSFQVRNGRTRPDIGVEPGQAPRRIDVGAIQPGTPSPLLRTEASRTALHGQAGLGTQDGSFTRQVAFGDFNVGGTFIAGSPRAAISTLQLGTRNVTRAVVENSPRSVIAQFQRGEELVSDVAIVGGRDNAVATAQIGNSLGLSLTLLDSIDTTVVYGQAGEGYYGGLTIRDAPGGTIIRLN